MNLWALGVYIAVTLGLAGLMIGLSALLGERHWARATGDPYESGIAPTGSGRPRLSAHFYMVAMTFVIFDLEAVYLFAWAVAAPDVGWTGYIEILIFTIVLLVALAYLWRAGALDWGPERRRMSSEGGA